MPLPEVNRNEVGQVRGWSALTDSLGLSDAAHEQHTGGGSEYAEYHTCTGVEQKIRVVTLLEKAQVFLCECREGRESAADAGGEKNFPIICRLAHTGTDGENNSDDETASDVHGKCCPWPG